MCGVKYYSSEMLKKLPKTKKFIDDNIESTKGCVFSFCRALKPTHSNLNFLLMV